MNRVIVAEVRRATGRRLLRILLLLGVLVAAVAGVLAFVRSGSLEQSVYEQRATEARARQNRFEEELRRCMDQRGGDRRSEEAFRACAPDGLPPAAKDPRFTARG